MEEHFSNKFSKTCILLWRRIGYVNVSCSLPGVGRGGILSPYALLTLQKASTHGGRWMRRRGRGCVEFWKELQAVTGEGKGRKRVVGELKFGRKEGGGGSLESLLPLLIPCLGKEGEGGKEGEVSEEPEEKGGVAVPLGEGRGGAVCVANFYFACNSMPLPSALSWKEGEGAYRPWPVCMCHQMSMSEEGEMSNITSLWLSSQANILRERNLM